MDYFASLYYYRRLNTLVFLDSRAVSEPHLRTSNGPEDDEPAAVIVDVEDVIEETAAPLPVTPVVQSQTPVYCYAPEEVTRLIDSSGRLLYSYGHNTSNCKKHLKQRVDGKLGFC